MGMVATALAAAWANWLQEPTTKLSVRDALRFDRRGNFDTMDFCF
jgi:hypothetical protein